MKRISALILALALLASALPAAFAANATPNTTTLTTTVPSATYVLNIPADQEIPCGQRKKRQLVMALLLPNIALWRQFELLCSTLTGARHLPAIIRVLLPSHLKLW